MMENWKEVRLNDFVWFQRGYDLPKAKFKEGNVPVYGSTTILGYHNIPKVKAPGIITGRSGTLGVMQFAKEDFWPHNTSLWVKDFKGNDEKFAYYLLQCLDFSLFNSGGAVPTLNRNVLNSFVINLPPLPTQRKIASILSAYDDLIENNLKRIKLLEEKAQLTYEEWFVLRKLNGEKIVDSQTSIESLSAHIDRFINGGWGKEEIEGNYFKEAYVIRGTDMPKVSKGQFDDLPLRYHTESNLKSRLLQHGDIAIEMSNGNIGNVGRSFYFDSGLSKILCKPTICASFCKMIRPKAINLSYLIDAHLKYIYNTDKMMVYKSQAANGINNFNFDEMIKDEELYIPKGEKLNVLTNAIKLNYDAISNIRIQNHRLKEARDILLPRLMTGMIDVEKMDIETLQPTTA